MSKFFCAILLFALSVPAYSVQLVTDKAIEKQKNLTEDFKLKNGIPVIYRKVPSSDILQINVNFALGLKDIRPGKKVANQWLWSVAPMATKSYSKQKLFEQTEKYALGISCSGGIEMTTCSLGTLNDFVDKGLPILASVIKEPALTAEDLKLTKQNLVATLKNRPVDPGSYINDVINRIFYPKGHPYRHNWDDALKELEKLGVKDLQLLHSRILNAELMSIVVVGSISKKDMQKKLDAAFGKIPAAPHKPTPVPVPKYNAKADFSFEDRDIPTAYIRAKVVTPPADAKTAVADRLMFEILSEELAEEIRTKRSLSYSVYSYVIQYSMGIGVLAASTSKPKETLEALDVVLNKIKDKTYTKIELEEYKRGFATSYYQTQETHGSLANAIGSSFQYKGGVNKLYDMPRHLDKVTAADIKTSANNILVNLRIGVIYGRKNFQDSWAKNLINKHRKQKKSH